MKVRALIELVLAAAAVIGSVASWLSARSTESVAPVIPGEPSKTAMVYDPSMITLALLLATVAGVLIALGVARLRRSDAAH